MARLHTTKEFLAARSALSRAGERAASTKLGEFYRRVALGQSLTAWIRDGREARIPNAELFNIDERFQVIAQRLHSEGEERRVLLFVGSSSDCDAWLEQHRGYQYVVDPNHRLRFIPLNASPREVVRQVNPELAPQVVQEPLLRHLTDDDWSRLDVGPELRGELAALSHMDFGEPIVEKLLARLPPVRAAALFDVMIATNEGRPENVRARLAALHGGGHPASPAEIIDALDRPINSDEYVTFDDPEELERLLRRESWEDWMLFLHERQREVVVARYGGPARVRGVSGSGKTSIVVHRARVLARRYERPVLIVTLTSSMTKLIGHLADVLCGVEASLIQHATTHALSQEVIKQLAPSLYRGFRAEPLERELRQMRIEALRGAGTMQAWRQAGLSRENVEQYLDDEMADVRENFLVGERDQWLVSERRGRGRPMPKDVRECVLRAIEAFEETLRQKRTADPASLVLHAMEAALGAREALLSTTTPPPIPFARCILVDEGQDLSTNELRLLMALTDHAQDDAFFIASDSAQRIFRRKTSPKSAGLDVRGRAVVFRKNYRNTAQILRAARRLLDAFDVVELDEENETPRIDVDLPGREGSRPEVIRFENRRDEVAWVVDEIRRVREQEPATLGAGIGVVSPSPAHREAIVRGLANRGVPVTQLRDDVIASSEPVKVSTIESAKGHEFSAVFMPGLSDGLIPRQGSDDEARKREAARVYVAMTRARDRLVMTWDREQGPSPYLTSMMSACWQGIFRSGTLQMDEDEPTR